MHKITTLLSLLLCLSGPLCALNPGNISADIFQDDLSKLDCEMAELSQLEQLVNETKVTQSQLMGQGNPLAKHLLEGGDLAGSLFGSSAPEHERLLDIPGFLWGFCCSFIGAFLVYLSIDDPASKKNEGKQALFGCAAGTLFWVALYVWLVVSVSYY